MIRRSCSVSATSVSRFFPSGAVIFNCTIFSYTSTAPSAFNFLFKSLQYRRGFSVPVKTEITSTMEKYHSSVSSSHAVRIVLFSKSCNLSFSMNPFLSSSGAHETGTEFRFTLYGLYISICGPRFGHPVSSLFRPSSLFCSACICWPGSSFSRTEVVSCIF